jgi:hypothetical protein
VSAGNVLRVDEDGLIMESIGVLRNGCELNVVLLLGDFWIDKEVQLVMG